MNEMFTPQQILEYIRTGEAFQPGEPLCSDSALAWQPLVREAVRSGLMHTWRKLLYPTFELNWMVAEASDVDRSRGQPLAKGERTGDWQVFSPNERIRFLDQPGSAAPFSHVNLLIPGINSVELSEVQSSGVVEVRLSLFTPPNKLRRDVNEPPLDLLIYCQDPDRLESFRTLARGEWQFNRRPLWPQLGVGMPFTESESWRSPVCKLLNRVQPPCSQRFLRIPFETIRDSNASVLKFSVRMGVEAASIMRELKGRIRLNCFPFWNSCLALTEGSAALGTGVTIDAGNHRTSPDHLLVLDCYDRESERLWFDRRFAADQDLADTFTVEINRSNPSIAELKFASEPPKKWLIRYLAGLAPFRSIPPEAAAAATNGQHFFSRSGSFQAPDAIATMADECPAGRVVSQRELLELIWKMTPPAVRRNIDEGNLKAVSIREELDVIEDERFEGRGRAIPVTRVTFPRKTRAPGEILDYWLRGLAREAEQYSAKKIVIDIRPPKDGVNT